MSKTIPFSNRCCIIAAVQEWASQADTGSFLLWVKYFNTPCAALSPEKHAPCTVPMWLTCVASPAGPSMLANRTLSQLDKSRHTC